MKILIKNVRILTPKETLLDYGVIIDKGKINTICRLGDIDPSFEGEVFDGEGKYLSPGFIDIHNHGNSGHDVMDASEECLDKMAEFHLKNGVTSFLGTVVTSSYDNMMEASENIVNYRNKDELAELVGIHLEGPFFSVEKKGAQPEKYIREPDIDYITALLDKSRGRLKMVSLAPEAQKSGELISFLRKNNVVVAMAHSNATYEEALFGINSGATVATHLYNGMRAFTHREPGVVGASLLDDRVYCELIYDRVHVHDKAAKMAIKLKTPEKMVLVSDAMRAAGLEDGDYELGGQRVIVKNQEARLESGSLAGSLLNLNKAVKNAIKYLDLSMVDAVRMATLSAAEAVNIDKNKGSIEVGKDADLILFDENINISYVFKDNNVIKL